MGGLGWTGKVNIGESVIKIVRDELSPEDVFSFEELSVWAEGSEYFVNVNELPKFVKDCFGAEDIYGKDYMEKWALANGFVRKEE